MKHNNRRASLAKTVMPGEMLPRFYGVAWVDMMRDRAVCLPVPLNLVAALLRSAWLFAKHGWRPVRINPRDAFEQGRKAGRKEAP